MTLLMRRLICMTPHSLTTPPALESNLAIEERIEVYAAAARHYLVDRMVVWVTAA
jgi:hypothetical protein